MTVNIFCRDCGTKLEPDARFCNACGGAVAASTAPAEVKKAASGSPLNQRGAPVPAGPHLSDQTHSQERINRASNKLRVSSVNEGSQAERLGIKVGDYFLSYNRESVSSNSDLSRAANAAKSKKLASIPIMLLRGEQELYFEASLEPLGLNCEEPSEEFEAQLVGSTHDYKTEYGVARFMLRITSFAGWVLVIIGAFISAIAIANGMRSGGSPLSFMAALPGVGATIVGLLVVMVAQITQATVDNADHSREIMNFLYGKMTEPSRN